MTVGVVRLRGHGAGTDFPWDWTVWQTGRWRQGKCVWFGSFETKGEALAAVGLTE